MNTKIPVGLFYGKVLVLFRSIAHILAKIEMSSESESPIGKEILVL